MFQLDTKNWHQECENDLKSTKALINQIKHLKRKSIEKSNQKILFVYLNHCIKSILRFAEPKNQSCTQYYWIYHIYSLHCLLQKDKCHQTESTIFKLESKKSSKQQQCSPFEQNIEFTSKNQLEFYKKLHKLIFITSDSNLTNHLVANLLYTHAIDQLSSHGFSQLPSIIANLRQSSCLDHSLASFVLSIIYLHGIGLKSNQTLVKTQLKNKYILILTHTHKPHPVFYHQVYILPNEFGVKIGSTGFISPW